MNEQPIFLGVPHCRDYIFDGHAGTGPSGAERWMNCTASLSMAREFLESLSPAQRYEFARGSAAAREGTTAHAAAESAASLLLGEISQSEHNTTLTELTVMPDDGEAYSEEMGEYISEYVDLIRQFRDEGRKVLLEQRVSALISLVDLGHKADPLLDEVYEVAGSVDCGALPTEKDKTLVVVDLKYGQGKDVSVDANPQIRIYGLGLIDALCDEEGNLTVDIDRVDYYIVQPRLGGIKMWSESLDDLLDWRDDVLSPALTLALNGPDAGAQFSPDADTTCRWCPARGSCSALADHAVQRGAELFTIISESEVANGPGAFPETGTLSDSRLASLLTQVDDLVKIRDALRAEAQRRLYRGKQVPGYKLVSYTPPRKWKDGAEKKISESSPLWKPRTLVTPKQALTLLADNEEAKATVEDLIESPPKKPVIAPVTDRRADWVGLPANEMFDEIDD